jgi:hypothetical protein
MSKEPNEVAVIEEVTTKAHLAPDMVNVTFTTTSPEMVRQAQEPLKRWLAAKIEIIEDELDQVTQSIGIARRNKWGTVTTLKNQQRRLAQDFTFYEKQYEAIEAGYTIFPSLPINQVEVIAVRRNRTPNRKSAPASRFINKAEGQSLPPGEGEYYDGLLLTEQRHWTTTRDDGVEEVETDFVTVGMDDEVVWPVVAARPELMKAAEKAMAHKIFDEILCAGVTKRHNDWDSASSFSDPVIIGTVRLPKRDWRPAKRVSFMIGWFLDTRTL